jgi:hypothetical protein
MVDPKNLSDEQLEQRVKRLEQRDGDACCVSALGFVASVISGLAAGFSPIFLVFATVVLAGLAAGQFNQSFLMNPCEAELKKRKDIQEQQTAALKAIAEGKSPLEPGMSGAFNPAAATVLDNDMRRMAPLRLKTRIREFAHG